MKMLLSCLEWHGSRVHLDLGQFIRSRSCRDTPNARDIGSVWVWLGVETQSLRSGWMLKLFTCLTLRVFHSVEVSVADAQRVNAC